ncbi:60S acidic ribosomal protein P0 (macronuclear) [Tetrahymena thermophila SB210]|uniref:60S acidic ribosomal protein P0 n=2 Tax=Tetrahymena thermophila TaxID=5911 RepID=Q22HK6_TETTS|nr:60S acidic ribosomal protein P0 [Tetrahymena thermophila SB210]AAY19283.1 acidic ribosomal P0 protein [Tetrahymena thermophila]EAR84695.2 60S acidic ribosomal protein P0 [Tetrahymena thermophila SB210]|eukprot:XP_001032358.2 60S acidic ribosomal protein P0 [Tetrahymena thermophila SB210]
MPPAKVDKKAKKDAFIRRFYELLSKYDSIALCTLENVGSLQLQQIRRSLGSNNIMVIGKNTVVRKAVQLKSADLPTDSKYDWYRQFGAPKPQLASLIPHLKNKIAYVFHNDPIFALKPKIESFVVPAPARVGTVAQKDVMIPPGPTGMDPSQINFFHALSISTKIQKGQIEITKEVQVCTKGKKIGNSEVSLLEKMNIQPFSYGMKCFSDYDNGEILTEEVLSISPSVILDAFAQNTLRIAAVSLATGYVTAPSVPHFIQNAFKDLAAIGMETGYKFKEIENAGQAVAVSAPAAKTETKAAAKPVVEEKPAEPEEDLDMGDLFG